MKPIYRSADVLFSLFAEQLRRGLRVEEESVDFIDILGSDFRSSFRQGKLIRGRKKLH